MLTATGFIVICVAASSTCTANAVASPPRPCGPTPSMLTAADSSDSSCAPSGSSQWEPKRPRRSDLGQVHAQVRRAADADADDRRRTGLAAGVEHAIHNEGPDRIDPLSGDSHLEPRVVLGAAALGDHFDPTTFEIRCVVDMDHRHADAARRVLVLARQRMHDRRAQRVFARRTLAAAADRMLHRRAVDLDVATDGDVVNGNARILAEQVVGCFRDRDVADHRREHALRLGSSSRAARAWRSPP